MDPLLDLSMTTGFFTRPQAMDAGWSDKQIAQAVRHADWTRFRRGYYCHTDVWQRHDDVGRHRIRCSAVIHSLGAARVALSHESGCVVHGQTTWGFDLEKVHVTRLDGGAGRLEGDVVHHEGLVVDEDLDLAAGLPVLDATRCALEAGSRTSNETALCLFDDGLHRGIFDDSSLFKEFTRMQYWPRMRHLHIPVRLADGRSASVGESRGRWFFWANRLPGPALQCEIRDADGTLLGITDWGWPEHGVLGEFDGRVKYGRLLQPGAEPGDVVFAEKQREDAIRRATGFTMERIVWSDYDRPGVLATRLRRVLGTKAC